ncbi:MAG: hypothetical protein CPDRYMAC_0528 [uncultured Paraburkholderia sp.]|nr:MAG: hypothetical protein CPDRYMAC_0528 [uncultured Paraburkholderia sp.]
MRVIETPFRQRGDEAMRRSTNADAQRHGLLSQILQQTLPEVAITLARSQNYNVTTGYEQQRS